MLTEKGWDSNVPPMPVVIAYHCIVLVNATTVMVIGGYQRYEDSGKTFYFNKEQQSWTEGPELTYKRSFLSCGRIRKNKDSQEMSIIAVGGFIGGLSISSTEILDAGSNEWRNGPQLPLSIGASQLVEDQQGRVVLVGGGTVVNGTNVILDTLYYLSDGGVGSMWTKMDQKLKIGRYFHSAFLVHDNITNCS